MTAKTGVVLKRFSKRTLFALCFVALLGSAVVGVFWAVQRIDTHKRWASMLRESQRLRDHLDRVALLLPAKFQANPDSTSQNWFIAELHYADSSLLELINLDQRHQVPLYKIDNMITTLSDPDIDLSWLNSTEQEDLMETIHNIGRKVVKAYGNLLNYTSVNNVNGPPFWYFGPAPPDEGILEEAVQLATNVTTEMQQASLNLQGFVVVHIGETDGLSAQVANAMESLEANVTFLQSLPTMKLNDSVIILFDTTWIKDRVNDTNLHEFFREAAPKGVSLVAIGNETSSLYYALDEAGVYKDSNPADFNPAVAGFRMELAVSSTGTESRFPSIFISNTNVTANWRSMTETIDGIVQDIASWYTEE